jgi:hypothetical protein
VGSHVQNKYICFEGIFIWFVQQFNLVLIVVQNVVPYFCVIRIFDVTLIIITMKVKII